MQYTAKFPNSIIEKRFWKELHALPQALQEDILKTIRDLEHNPRPFGQKPFKQLKPPIHVYDYTAQYRVRIGNWRVLYDVDDKHKTVWIFVLRQRNEKTYR